MGPGEEAELGDPGRCLQAPGTGADAILAGGTRVRDGVPLGHLCQEPPVSLRSLYAGSPGSGTAENCKGPVSVSSCLGERLVSPFSC